MKWPRPPFAHLNLRRNPFGELDADERAALAVVDVAPLADGEVVQFIGDSGRGKTTHLLALMRLHADALYDRLGEGETRPHVAVRRGGIWLLDEAQRASPRFLRRGVERARACAFGTHQDLSAALGRSVKTVHVGGLSPEKLDAIVRRRIEAVRRGPGPLPRVPQATLQALIHRHGDDLRAIERTLYFAFQNLEELRDVELPPEHSR